ncbi:MAG: hypothetical protein DI536_27015 [Archangium gephyra]|uniref:Cytochrome c domain-containing protein n=1 Tax=Archangium gephyra TaxID=48 RepID=A0A2W5T0G9_9BACT|nr:MAG: hypothetical protein DI536_27015 [Archangium gephyra]
MNRLQFVVLLTLVSSGSAHAYGFMLRHDYTSCASCHVDPSGGSVVTPYGRAQGELLLRSRYGAPADEDPGKKAEFLLGLLAAAPEELMLGGDVRLAVLSPGMKGVRVFPMQIDVVGALKTGKMSASVSLGLGSAVTSAAKIVGEQVQLISRHHWVGYAPDEDQAFLLRVGRIPLPFGLRLPEHTIWARAVTKTDTNVSQQHGVSLAYSGERVRGELMGIVGNLQLSPAAYRERGYSGFLEFIPNHWMTVGVSSLVTHADSDLSTPQFSTFRHAHGAFLRASPWKPLVISVEADLTNQTRRTLGGPTGFVGVVQADIEPTQGFHLVAMGEVLVTDFSKPDGVGFGGWGGVWWFFAPHSDVRLDVITRRETDGTLNVSLLGQVHVFL